MNFIGSYQFDDCKTLKEDVFSRDPYILRFTCLTTGEPYPKTPVLLSLQYSPRVGLSLNWFVSRAAGPGADPRSHNAWRLRDRAGQTLRCVSGRQEKVGDWRKDALRHFVMSDCHFWKGLTNTNTGTVTKLVDDYFGSVCTDNRFSYTNYFTTLLNSQRQWSFSLNQRTTTTIFLCSLWSMYQALEEQDITF